MPKKKDIDRPEKLCAIYARYSSHSQRDVSIEQQVSDCEAYARMNGYQVLKVYADRHMSGTTDKRPQFQKMLKDAEKGHWQYVLTWKVDRFARNRYDSATYKFRLKRCGVQVIYAKEAIPDGPEGILLESVLEGSAEYYSANLSQNIKRGMRYNAQECKVNNGSMPFGYCKGPDGRYAIVDAEAEIVREIFQQVNQGVPFAHIANDLNARGIRTKRGNLWNKGSFHGMMKNESYIGVYTYSDVRVEGGMPAIIDKALFLEVDQKLKTKKNPQGRHRENGDYLLTGKLFCGPCGSPMVGISGTGRHGELHYYYSCQKRRLEHSCQKENVRRDWIERTIVEAAINHVLKPEVMEWIADAVMAYQERQKNSAALIGLRDDLKENEKAINNMLKAIEAGIITTSTKERLVQLEEEKKQLENAICMEEACFTHVDREFLLYWMERFQGGNINDAGFRRKVIQSFVNSVYLWDDHLRIAFNYTGKGSTIDSALVLQAEKTAGAEGSYMVLSSPPDSGPNPLGSGFCCARKERNRRQDAAKRPACGFMPRDLSRAPVRKSFSGRGAGRPDTTPRRGSRGSAVRRAKRAPAKTLPARRAENTAAGKAAPTAAYTPRLTAAAVRADRPRTRLRPFRPETFRRAAGAEKSPDRRTFPARRPRPASAGKAADSAAAASEDISARVSMRSKRIRLLWLLL